MESKSKVYTISTAPRLVRFIKQVGIYEAGSLLKLFYGGFPDAMYKYEGAIFGISVSKVVNALNSGAAIEYVPQLSLNQNNF